MSVPYAMDPPPAPAPVTVPRSIIHRPESVQDWGSRKANNLPESNELDDTMKISDQELYALLDLKSPPYQAPLAEPQQTFHGPQSAQDWENQMAKISDSYESNELNDTRKITEEELSVPFAMSPPPVPAPLAVSHPIIHRPQSVQDWGDQNTKITNLCESNELNDAMMTTEQELFALFAMNSPLNQALLPVTQPQDWEYEIGKISDCYEYNEPNDTMKITDERLSVPFAMDLPLVQAPLAASLPIFHRPQPVQDWGDQNTEITNLCESNELNDAIMTTEQELFALFAMHSPLNQALLPVTQPQDWEYEIGKISDCYEYNEPNDTMKITDERLSVPFAMDLPLVQAPLAASLPIFHRPQPVQDWGDQNTEITNLCESNELNDTKKITDQELYAIFDMKSPPNQAPLAAPQQIFHCPQSARDWENQMAKIARRYESNELNDRMNITEEELSVLFAMGPPPVPGPLAGSRPIFHRPQLVQDWKIHKAKITDLYESNELKDTMKIMEEQHGFKATLNQYKKQLGKWGLDNKRIKGFEYQAMLKKKRKREQQDPPKKSAFRLRGAEVVSKKIRRYKKRKGVNEDDVKSDVETPSDLSCYTPVISCSPAPPSPMSFSIEDVNANNRTGLGSNMTSFYGSNSFQDRRHPFLIKFRSSNKDLCYESFDAEKNIKHVFDTVFVLNTSLSSLIQDLSSYGWGYKNLAGDIKECFYHLIRNVLGLSSSSDTKSSFTTFKILYCTEIEVKTLTGTGWDWGTLTDLANARLLRYIFTMRSDMVRGRKPGANNIIISRTARGFEETCTDDGISENQEACSSEGWVGKAVFDGKIVAFWTLGLGIRMYLMPSTTSHGGYGLVIGITLSRLQCMNRPLFNSDGSPTWARTPPGGGD